MVDFRQHTNRVLSKAMDIFGESVTFYPKSGGLYKARGVFDNEFQSIDPDTEEVLAVNQPALGVNLNDFPVDLKQGDELELRGIRFRIADKREDGQGGATLFLHKVRASDRLPDTRASEA